MAIRKVAFWSCILLLVGLALWILGWNLYANHKEKLVREVWAKTLIPLDEIEKKFPPSPANATALELERLAAAIGIDLAPELDKQRPHPSRESAQAREEGLEALGTYLYGQLEKSNDGIAPSPASAEEFLESERTRIETIILYLLDHEPPRWEVNLDQAVRWEKEHPGTSNRQTDNLIGLVRLHRTLALEALLCIQMGEQDRALNALDAMLKLYRGCADRPELTAGIVGLPMAKLICGVQRKIGREAQGWSEFAAWDFRKTLAFTFEVEDWGHLSRMKCYGHSLPVWAWPFPRPMDHMNSINLSYAYMLRAQACLEPDPCGFDPEAWKKKTALRPAPWNLYALITTPNLDALPKRLFSTLTELELTQRVMEARRLKGNWPSRNWTAPSALCKQNHWEYSVNPDRSLAITLKPLPAWYKPKEPGDQLYNPPLTYILQAN